MNTKQSTVRADRESLDLHVGMKAENKHFTFMMAVDDESIMNVFKRRFTKKDKYQPAGGALCKVRRSPKSLGFIYLAPWMLL